MFHRPVMIRKQIRNTSYETNVFLGEKMQRAWNFMVGISKNLEIKSFRFLKIGQNHNFACATTSFSSDSRWQQDSHRKFQI